MCICTWSIIVIKGLVSILIGDNVLVASSIKPCWWSVHTQNGYSYCIYVYMYITSCLILQFIMLYAVDKGLCGQNVTASSWNGFCSVRLLSTSAQYVCSVHLFSTPVQYVCSVRLLSTYNIICMLNISATLSNNVVMSQPPYLQPPKILSATINCKTPSFVVVSRSQTAFTRRESGLTTRDYLCSTSFSHEHTASKVHYIAFRLDCVLLNFLTKAVSGKNS